MESEINMDLVQKLYKASMVCTIDDCNCEKCPYEDHCADKDHDELAVFKAILDNRKIQGSVDSKKILATLFTLRGRLESAWSMEKDDRLSLLLEDCVNDYNYLVDLIIGSKPKQNGESA